MQLAGGAQVDGQFVEKCADEVAVLVSGQRRLILVADVISISRPLRREASASGRSLAMGAAIGAGLLFVAILVARAAAR